MKKECLQGVRDRGNLDQKPAYMRPEQLILIDALICACLLKLWGRSAVSTIIGICSRKLQRLLAGNWRLLFQKCRSNTRSSRSTRIPERIVCCSSFIVDKIYICLWMPCRGDSKSVEREPGEIQKSFKPQRISSSMIHSPQSVFQRAALPLTRAPKSIPSYVI